MTIELRDDAKRHFHGYVTRFGVGRHSGRHHGYQATVRPWLWFLTRTTDCRIFQELSVPDIVKKVFEDHGIADFEFKLYRSYRTWTYCVQYRESDYNFVARLLELEGIYWYFDHSDSAHKLVLVDSSSAHDAAPGCDSLPYFDNAAEAPPDTDFVGHWTFAREVRTGQIATTSYDFERPATSLEVQKNKQRTYELSDYEQFDFQGDYVQADDGTHWADNRIDEVQSRFERLRGGTNAQGLACGRLLKLTHHPREDQNAEYLITGTAIHAHQADGRKRRRPRVLVRLRRDPVGAAVPPAAAHAQAVRAGAADGGRRRPGRRGDPHRQVRPRQGAVPLGPLRQEQREELVAGCACRSPGPARAGARSTSRASARRWSSTFSKATPTSR